MDGPLLWFDNAYTIVSYLSPNIVSSVKWFMNSGYLRHVTYDRSLFNIFHDKDGVMG